MVPAIVHATVSKRRRLQGFYIWCVLSSMTQHSLRYMCITMDHVQRQYQCLQCRRQHYREQKERETQEERLKTLLAHLSSKRLEQTVIGVVKFCNWHVSYAVAIAKAA